MLRIVIALLLVTFIVLQYRLWVGKGSLAEVNNLKREITQLEQDLDKLRERNRALQAEVDDLRGGLSAIEERARSELGMIKKGEIFYQVIEEDQRRTHE